jgi:hypothetical protein
VSADLMIALVFSEPGMPRGRGKIERFFRTVNLYLYKLSGGAFYTLCGVEPCHPTPSYRPWLNHSKSFRIGGGPWPCSVRYAEYSWARDNPEWPECHAPETRGGPATRNSMHAWAVDMHFVPSVRPKCGSRSNASGSPLGSRYPRKA